jgi:uncharacterized protein YjbI with pentapeptide repeats
VSRIGLATEGQIQLCQCSLFLAADGLSSQVAARRILEVPLAAPCGSLNSETPRKAQEAALANRASLIYNGSTTSEENVMANQEHLALLHQSIATWNTWRKEHQDIQPDLSEADLSYADLHSADLSYADLNHANLSNADLRGAVLSGVILRSANLRSADLSSADLELADLQSADLSYANLTHANLRSADLSYANLHDADLDDADLRDSESN